MQGHGECSLRIAWRRRALRNLLSVSADRPAWVDEDLFPFASRYVGVGGARLHHVDEGDGPLLLLHGNPRGRFCIGT